MDILKKEAKVLIKRGSTIVRRQPTTASSIVTILEPLGLEYKSSKYQNGYYYIDEFKGWVESENLIIVNSTLDMVPKDDEDDEEEGNIPSKPSIYDPEEVIKAIIQASSKIPASCVEALSADRKTKVNLETLVHQLMVSLQDMNGAITKMLNIPDFPTFNRETDAYKSLVLIPDPDSLEEDVPTLNLEYAFIREDDITRSDVDELVLKW